MKSKTPATAGKTGSPKLGEPEYLAIGTLRRPHGLRGDMVMQVITDFPERIQPKDKIFIGDKYEVLTIADIRGHNEGLLISFKGLNTPEAVGKYRNKTVFVKTADRPQLPEGQYYHHQLLGFSVVDENGKPLGELIEILVTGANDVYVVSQNGKEILIPAIEGVLLGIDINKKEITVHLLDGLLDESE